MRTNDGQALLRGYDNKNRANRLISEVAGTTTATAYTYGDGTVGKPVYGVSVISVDGSKILTYNYDNLGRLDSSKLGSSANGTETTYTYVPGTQSGRTSTLVQSATTAGVTTSYKYDVLGNITEIREANVLKHSYAYDALEQLIRENDAVQNKTFTYAYDNGGNMTVRREYAYTLGSLGTVLDTITYGYTDSAWFDMMTRYDGQTITYDAIGNPLTYRDGMSFTWARGRNLSEFTNGTATASYTYDDNGIRNSKTVNGVTTKYFLSGSNIMALKNINAQLNFFYDEDGDVIGFIYGGALFFYQKNLQGDIVAIRNNSGTVLVEYSYDAWGNILSVTGSYASTIGQLNSFRYRGYLYDEETGFYYVSSRYYDPETGRFINADAAIGQIGNVQGTNMFAYCFNNPVNMSDPTGNWPKLSTIFTVVAVAAVAVAAVAVTVATCGAAAPALAVAGGGIIGGISAGAAATAASVATGAMIVAGVSTAAAVTSAVAEKAVEKTAKRNNSVYVLKDDAGTVQYVGRTNNVDKRRAAHSANPACAGLEMEVIASGLNLPESRALEQAGMAYYHTINTANKMNNQINSVSPKYWGAFKELALGTLNYGWNQMSNEILYWTGN